MSSSMDYPDETAVDDTTRNLMKINDLLYEEPQELTVVQQQREREFLCATPSVAGADSFYVDLQLGSDLMTGRKSYISFDLNVTFANAINQTIAFPINVGAMGMFRTLIVRSRGGQEMQRLTDRHISIRRDANSRMPMWATDQMSQWLGDVSGTRTITSTGAASTVTQRINIPLALLIPFFDQQKLIPTNSLGQIRLEFTLVNAALLGTWTNAVGSYTINNIKIWAHAVTLSDMALRTLNLIAVDTGLAVHYRDILQTTQATTASTVTITSTAARARCLGAWVHPILNSEYNSATSDSTKTWPIIPGNTGTRVFWQLGSIYFPVREIGLSPVVNGSSADAIDLYTHTQINSNNFVTGMYDRVAQMKYSTWIAGYGWHEVQLERSDVLEANGSAVSASRPLTCQLAIGSTGGYDPATGATVHLFIEHYKLANVFSDGNVIINE